MIKNFHHLSLGNTLLCALVVLSCSSQSGAPASNDQNLAVDSSLPAEDTPASNAAVPNNTSSSLNEGILENGTNSLVNFQEPAPGATPPPQNAAPASVEELPAGPNANLPIANASPAPTNSMPAPANAAVPPPINSAPATANAVPPPINSATPATNAAPVTTNSSTPPINSAPVAANSSVPPVNSEPATTAPTEAVAEVKKPSFVMTQEELDNWRAAATKLRLLTDSEAPEEYTIQPGDTLWDICDQLLDNYQWWPKLWSLNPTIANPNMIFPGQKLVFYASDGSSEPSLVMRDIGQATPISLDSPLISKAMVVGMHPWQGKEALLLDPNEIPTDSSFELVSSSLSTETFSALIPGYLSSSRPASIGEVVDKHISKTILMRDSLGYAEFDSPPQIGQRYLAVRPGEKGVTPNGDDLGGPDLYLYTGIIGITKIHKSGVVGIFVEDSIQGVMPGDKLIPFKNITVQVDPRQEGPTSSLKAEILSMGDEKKGLSFTGQMIVLERTEGNVNLGDSIDLYMPAGGAFNFAGNNLDGIFAAKAKVVDVTEESVVAIILYTEREISVGARTWPEFD